MQYKVKITEIAYVSVEADDEDDAVEKIQQMVEDGMMTDGDISYSACPAPANFNSTICDDDNNLD